MVGLIVGRGIFVAISKMFSMLSYSNRMPSYPQSRNGGGGGGGVYEEYPRSARVSFSGGKVVPRISQ